MSNKLGFAAKLFYGSTAGVMASTEMKNVKDVTISLTKGTADITTRASSGWRVKVATLKEGTVDFEMNYDPEDAEVVTIMNAFINDTPLSFFVSDGSGNGLSADFEVAKAEKTEPLEDVQKLSVSLEPTIIGGTASRHPRWITGSTVGNA